MAQTVDTSGLDRLLKSWDRLLKGFPEVKRQALEQMGRDLLLNVQEEIGGSGKVAGWQAPHLGSGGGYVSIRAKANEYQTTRSGKRYAVGRITNAIEGGHRSRAVDVSDGAPAAGEHGAGGNGRDAPDNY